VWKIHGALNNFRTGGLGSFFRRVAIDSHNAQLRARATLPIRFQSLFLAGIHTSAVLFCVTIISSTGNSVAALKSPSRKDFALSSKEPAPA
jgi:hypothetical protein